MAHVKNAVKELHIDEIADLTAHASVISIITAGLLACLIAL